MFTSPTDNPSGIFPNEYSKILLQVYLHPLSYSRPNSKPLPGNSGVSSEKDKSILLVQTHETRSIGKLLGLVYFSCNIHRSVDSPLN